MSGGGRVVGLVEQRDASELEERGLHAAPHRHDRLAQADRRPLPIRERQHDDAEHVREELSGNRDAELYRAREVGLHRLAGPVPLGEEYFLVRAVRCAPALHMALQRAELSWRVGPRPALREPLKQRLRFELRRLCEACGDRRPVLGRERTLPRAPGAWLRELARQLPLADVLARGLPVHVGLHGRTADLAVLLHLLHQLPHLRVGRLHAAIFREGGPWLREIAERHGWAMQSSSMGRSSCRSAGARRANRETSKRGQLRDGRRVTDVGPPPASKRLLLGSRRRRGFFRRYITSFRCRPVVAYPSCPPRTRPNVRLLRAYRRRSGRRAHLLPRRSAFPSSTHPGSLR